LSLDRGRVQGLYGVTSVCSFCRETDDAIRHHKRGSHRFWLDFIDHKLRAPVSGHSGEQVLQDVVFRLVAAGAISGHVTDTRGGPVTGILVQLLRGTYDAKGRRTFQPVTSARTNERGEYRMYLITPGRFFVSAAPLASPDPSMMAVNQVDEPGLVLTYYPGSSDPSGASSIEIEPGSETGPIDFRLMPQPLFRIRGRVLDARTGHSSQPVQLEIESRNPGSPGVPRRVPP